MADEEGWHHASHKFAADHPTAAGHFPGNPIIPGAVLLDDVVRVIAAAYKQTAEQGALQGVKFLAPLRPGDTLEIRWNEMHSQGIKFECLQAGKRALSGTLRLSPGPG
jgi:3-hydroxymyristoyl/3-hydroxydecanoyl-(acyl carrier protein) dehydratase